MKVFTLILLQCVEFSGSRQNLPQQLTSTFFLFVGSTEDTENVFDDALAHVESICKVLDTDLY